MVGLVWYVLFCRFCFVRQVWFGRIDMVGFVWKVWNYSGWVGLESGRVGPIVIIRLSWFKCNCNCLPERSLMVP